LLLLLLVLLSGRTLPRVLSHAHLGSSTCLNAADLQAVECRCPWDARSGIASLDITARHDTGLNNGSFRRRR